MKPVLLPAYPVSTRLLALTAAVRLELDANRDLVETYTFKNTGVIDLELPVGSARVNAMRRGTTAPHLGLVVTQDILEVHSQLGPGTGRANQLFDGLQQ